MSINFINKDFYLETKAAQKLYHEYAEGLPIIDYHCHLEPKEVAENKSWDNVTQVWLYGDHYKWRAMRSNGVAEKFCTDPSVSDYERFEKFAETMPRLLRNPIYHWTHLEMSRFFGIDDVLLSPKTAKEVYERANEVLKNGLNARKCMQMCNVETVCTTDDPVSELPYHKEIAQKPFGVKVLPAFRPDKAHAIADRPQYFKYLETLSAVSGVKIDSFDDLISALQQRHDYFDQNGCKLSDNGLDTMWYAEASSEELNKIFKKILDNAPLCDCEVAKFKSAVLTECAVMDSKANWVRQLHIGAMRNNNSIMFKKLGPDTGFDSIGESIFAKELSLHLDNLNSRGCLGKTILYNLHPKDNEMLATMLGNFQGAGVRGKLQLGSGWWFLDQGDGIKKQIESVSQLSLLANFVGMLTDSRSFLSYPRHEYFRRILCNILGSEMERGLLPNDFELVGDLVKNVSYYNAKNYFNF